MNLTIGLDREADGRWMAEALELRARVVERGGRKVVVACSVRQGSVTCASAEVVTVRVDGRN